MDYRVLAFYQFQKLERLNTLRDQIQAAAQSFAIQGLFILGPEGFNGTVAGLDQPLEEFYQALLQILGIAPFACKESRAPRAPFHRFRCKIRPEIVTTHDPSLDAKKGAGTHLSPQEWDEMLQEEDVVVLDTRNWYETRVGKFKNAIDPKLSQFHEFAQYLPQSGLGKDQKVMIYCTGGIRCEKAIVEMHRQGFENVYQLEGGILKYLEQFPEQGFEGECFVFDHRVALDQHLQPTQRYKLCPHCGQPGEIQIQCRRCETHAVICDNCHPTPERQTCSKNCAYHLRMGHRLRTKPSLSV